MRTINPGAFEVYQLDELDSDAREKAIEAIANRLGGDWWDQHDIDDIANVILYTLANEFGTPRHGEYGVGDFPGIPGVELKSWDLDRGNYVSLRGILTRDNALRLPWSEGVIQVWLEDQRDWTAVGVEFDDEMAAPDMEMIENQVDQVVKDATRAALKAGRDELEYKTGAAYAEETIRANGYEFEADGTPYFG